MSLCNKRVRAMSGMRGFTVIELLVVMMIMMAVALTALPTVTSVISGSRMRAGIGNVDATIHSARSKAIRSNQTKTVRVTLVNSEPFVYFADPSVTSITSTAVEGMTPVSKQSVFFETPAGTGAPTEIDAVTAFGSSTTTPLHGDMSFNSRGMPCQYASGACTTGVGFVWYFTFQPPFGSNRWAAVSVSPAGRVKQWTWDGNRWSN